MMRRHVALASLAVVFLISGCIHRLAEYTPATVATAGMLPDDFGPGTEGRSPGMIQEPEIDWWRGFGMPELEALLVELEAQNHDLQIAEQQVLRARALLGLQRSTNWPSLDGALTALTGTRTEVEEEDATRDASLGFLAGYEVDLMGRRSAANRAAEFDLVAQHAHYRGVVLSLQAQLASQFFDLLSLQDRVEATQQNVAATEELLALVTLLVDAGRASGVELNQQRNILLDQQSQLFTIERDLALSERALAVLLGRDEELAVRTTGRLDDASIPLVDVVQPAALLQTRPDIVVAENDLRIADALLYQSRTKRWPSLVLSGEATLAGLFTGGTTWATSLIGQLAGPLFDGGRTSSELRAAEADASIALSVYRLTVLRALQEALNALTELDHQRELYAVQVDAVETTERLRELARQRFDAGNIDFINLLDAQRAAFAANERLINAKRDYLVAVVNTFRAMGVPPALFEVEEDSESAP